MATKRKIEVFSAGCPVCDETVALVKQVACPSCDVTVLDMNDPSVAKRAASLGIRSVPAGRRSSQAVRTMPYATATSAQTSANRTGWSRKKSVTPGPSQNQRRIASARSILLSQAGEPKRSGGGGQTGAARAEFDRSSRMMCSVPAARGHATRPSGPTSTAAGVSNPEKA